MGLMEHFNIYLMYPFCKELSKSVWRGAALQLSICLSLICNPFFLSFPHLNLFLGTYCRLYNLTLKFPGQKPSLGLCTLLTTGEFCFPNPWSATCLTGIGKATSPTLLRCGESTSQISWTTVGTVWPNPPLHFWLTCWLPDFVQPISTFTYIQIALTYDYLCCRQPNKIRHIFQQRRNVGATWQACECGLWRTRPECMSHVCVNISSTRQSRPLR